MSAHNAEKYLREALESMLNQTLADFEFIIIDDASTDETQKIIKEYAAKDTRIKLISNPINLGLTKSLNIGLNQAQGEYIARLDADDLSEPERLQKQYDFMEAQPEYALVGSWVKIIDQDGQELAEKKPPPDTKLIKFSFIFGKPCLWHSSIFFRRDKIAQIGNYNEEYKYSQDLNLYVRLLKKGKITNVPEFLTKHRLHADSIGRKNSEAQHNFYLKSIFEFVNSNYDQISWEDLEIRDRARNQKIKSLKGLIRALKIDKHIYRSFLAKEKLDSELKKQMSHIYQWKRGLMIKGYLKNRVPGFYKRLKRYSGK
ncbi:MAG TPA: glycosyltransferase [Patescibacteria group bacterium]|nr:glycosyltransferase [Patescibacteria group bacterium]